jgi:hypothetical protein
MAMGSWSVYQGSGGFLTSMSFVVETYSHAGAAVDCSTFFQISFGGHTAIEIAEPGLTGSSIQGGGEAVECRNTEEGIACESVE